MRSASRRPTPRLASTAAIWSCRSRRRSSAHRPRRRPTSAERARRRNGTDAEPASEVDGSHRRDRDAGRLRGHEDLRQPGAGPSRDEQARRRSAPPRPVASRRGGRLVARRRTMSSAPSPSRSCGGRLVQAPRPGQVPDIRSATVSRWASSPRRLSNATTTFVGIERPRRGMAAELEGDQGQIDQRMGVDRRRRRALRWRAGSSTRARRRDASSRGRTRRHRHADHGARWAGHAGRESSQSSPGGAPDRAMD